MKNNLLVVLPFHAGDAEAAKRLLTWINDLNDPATPIRYPLLLVADSAVPMDLCRELGFIARKSFRSAFSLTVRVDTKDWKAPNLMFNAVSKWVKETYKLPFLWMEPDCTPTRETWLEEIAQAYADTAFKYMGALIESKQPDMPKIHMTGCGVYPQDAYDLIGVHSSTSATSAWDISSATDVVAKCQNTELIQHLYGEKGLPPTFVTSKEQGREYPINAISIDFIKPKTALFHRCKDGTLITELRKLTDTPEPLKPSILTKPKAAKPKPAVPVQGTEEVAPAAA